MTIRWGAVLLGLLADIFVSSLVQSFARPDFFSAPDVTNSQDLLILVLSALAIGIGGYVAGRIARQEQLMHGLLVGALDVLLSTFVGGLSRPFVFVEIAGWLLAGCCGYLSRFPLAQPTTPNERK